MGTRETIILDARAQHRLFVLNHVLTGGLTAPEAARVLHLSVRQVSRLLKRYRADGSAGLVHGNHDRTPAHRTPDAVRARIVELERDVKKGHAAPAPDPDALINAEARGYANGYREAAKWVATAVHELAEEINAHEAPESVVPRPRQQSPAPRAKTE